MSRPPSKLHRVNGHAAAVVLIQSMLRVRGGEWVKGAPSHIAAELLGELEERGFYLGVPSFDAEPADGVRAVTPLGPRP